LMLSAAVLLAACDQPTATDIEAQKQEQLTRQGINSVGLPAIVNFEEKRTLKTILELRDTKISTITYLVDMQSKLHKLCNSIGYGLPYATQYTNPQMATWSSNRGSVVLPQADPNGLYSPAAAEGTWVLCLDPNAKDKDNAVSPIYIEPRIIVSPFPLTEG